MATIGSLAVASDIANAALEFYVRGGALLQTQQERPLLAFLNSSKSTFPGGKQYISEPVQGTVMADTAGFYAGYTQDDALALTQGGNIQRAQVAWKEVACSLVITHTELKQDGISVTDGKTGTSEHSDVFLTRLTGLLENRMSDFSESYARSKNLMLWRDGSQDSKQVPGITSLLLDDPTTGTVAGLSQVTYTWWRSRAKLDLAPSPENQTMSKFFRVEGKQLTRYGGRPSKAFCGISFWEAVASEVEKKGIYTQSGFAGRTTNTGMESINLGGVGVLEYDPTLDDLGKSKYCYVLDGRRTKYRPMEGEENKIHTPERPYNYLVMIKTMTDTAGLIMTQLNGMGVYAIA